LRASESDRATTCPASLVLPRAPESEKPESTRKAANWGTLCHHWKETDQTDPDWADPAETKCLEKKLVLSGIRREDYWSGGEHEVTFAVELSTGEVMRFGDGGHLTRDEWKATFPLAWLTGTIDYLYPDGRGDDLKTGRWPVDPALSKQLRSYALLPWLEAGRPLRWEKEWTITTWERYPLAGLPRREGHLITGFELTEHLEELRWAVGHPEEARPTDDGCRFCMSKKYCNEYDEYCTFKESE
jgi:hypothetical protein